jgi:hypothetical protein
MSNQESNSGHAGGASVPEQLSATETQLGIVLALVHRILPKLDELSRSEEVQAALRQAAHCLESARQAHAHDTLARKGVGMPVQKVSTGVEPEIAAIIAAAVAVLFDRPYRLVSVQKVTTPVPHLNVWALEGRTQIFQSHRIR